MSFSQIRGQIIPSKILLNSINDGYLFPSYIFTGPEGIGKSLVVLNFAKLIDCLNPKDRDCCDRCTSCLKIQNYNHPDVRWIRKNEKGVIKIEIIRDLQKNIYLKPWEAKRKIFIIQEAESLTPEAQNSLLKILEEPPKENILVLITSKLNLIFPTIISRCKRIVFSPLNLDSLKKELIKDFNLEDSEAHFLAHFSEGRYGKAIGFKDRKFFKKKNMLLSYFLDEKPNSLDISFKDKAEFNLILSILISFFRDALFFKRNLSELWIIHTDQKERLLKFRERYTQKELEDIYEMLKDICLYYEQNVNPKLILNYLKMNLCQFADG